MRTVSLLALASLSCSPEPAGKTTSARAQALIVSVPVELDTTPVRPSELAPAPVTVANDGQNFVVAWQEERTVFTDVYTTRVTPTGTVLDPQSVRASRSRDRAIFFALAVGGGQQLTTWSEAQYGSGANAIMGALGQPGQVPSSQRINLLPSALARATLATLWDGTAFDLAVPRGTGSEIFFLRVFPDAGTSATSSIVQPSPNTQDVQSLAVSGGVIGVTSYQLAGTTLTHDFTVVDPVSGAAMGTQSLSTSTSTNGLPTAPFSNVAGDARGFVLANAAPNPADSSIHMTVRRIAPDGTPVGDAGLDLSPTSYFAFPGQAQVLPNGNSLVSFENGTYAVIDELTEDAGVFSVLSDVQVNDAGYDNVAPGLSCIGASCLLAWAPFSGVYSLRGAIYTAGGVLRTPFLMRQTAQPQWYPKAAFAEGHYLAVWVEVSQFDRTYYGRLMDETGAPLSAPFVIVQTFQPGGPLFASYDVVSSADRTLFLYSTGVPSQITGRFVDSDGGVGASFLVTTPTNPANQVSAAVDGDMTLVIWFSYLNNTHWGVFGARIAGDGTVLDPNGFFIADVGRDPTAAAISRGEQGFQLLWPDSETSSRKLLTATVFRDGGGGVDTTFALADLSATNTLALPSLGFDGVHHYGVYTDRSEPAPGIRLVQFDEDGGVAGDGGELLSTPGAFTYPGAIQCAEGECVLVYSELVGNAYELRGLQLSSDGGRRSFGNSLVTQPDDELLPTATPGDGGWLLSWARYQGAPFGGLRAVSRVIDPNATIPDAGSDGGVVDGGFTDAGFTDGGLSDVGITDGGELPDGGAPGRLHLRVGCGCDGASDLSVFALLLAASAVGIARRRSKARRGAERPV